MAALVFLLRRPFASLYGSAADPEVFRLSTTMIAILAVTLVGTSYHASCFVGINRGAGDSRFVAMVDMICGWLVVLPGDAAGGVRVSIGRCRWCSCVRASTSASSGSSPSSGCAATAGFAMSPGKRRLIKINIMENFQFISS